MGYCYREDFCVKCTPETGHFNALTGKAIAPKDETDRTHTVKHGDTLWKIAEQYLGKGGRYTEIVKLNGLKSNVLYTGQVLKIPEK